MKKNSQGFAHAAVIFLFLLVLIVIGLAANRIYSRVTIPKNGYLSQRFNMSMGEKTDGNYSIHYALNADFPNSVDTSSCGRSIKKGFTGRLNIYYKNADSAEVSVTQTIKPGNKDTSSSNETSQICEGTQDARSAIVTASAELEKSWLEHGSSVKSLLINRQHYSLIIDKNAYSLKFQDDENNSTLSAFLPDGLAALYTQRCMNKVELETYAADHGITQADSKYPGLTASLNKIVHYKPGELAYTPLSTNDPDQSLVVIANGFVKTLAQDQRNSDSCKVFATSSSNDYQYGTGSLNFPPVSSE